MQLKIFTAIRPQLEKRIKCDASRFGPGAAHEQ